MLDHFDLSATNFAFGVVPSSAAPLFRFRSELFPQYLVEHYTTSQDISDNVDSFTLNSTDDNDNDDGESGLIQGTLRLLRFTIGKPLQPGALAGKKLLTLFAVDHCR